MIIFLLKIYIIIHRDALFWRREMTGVRSKALHMPVSMDIPQSWDSYFNVKVQGNIMALSIFISNITYTKEFLTYNN
jgi:hypothetical protein